MNLRNNLSLRDVIKKRKPSEYWLSIPKASALCLMFSRVAI